MNNSGVQILEEREREYRIQYDRDIHRDRPELRRYIIEREYTQREERCDLSCMSFRIGDILYIAELY